LSGGERGKMPALKFPPGVGDECFGKAIVARPPLTPENDNGRNENC
jgi:hypothetical protein